MICGVTSNRSIRRSDRWNNSRRTSRYISGICSKGVGKCSIRSSNENSSRSCQRVIIGGSRRSTDSRSSYRGSNGIGGRIVCRSRSKMSIKSIMKVIVGLLLEETVRVLKEEKH